MGLFRTLGEKAERFKRQVEAATEESVECDACGTEFAESAAACPDCGADAPTGE